MGWGFVFRSTEIFSRLCICWPLEYVMFRTILVVWWMTQKHDVYYSVPLCNFHITTLILFIFVCPWWIKALQVICRNRLFVFSLCDCVSEGQAVIRHDYSISTGLFSSLARTWPTGRACFLVKSISVALQEQKPPCSTVRLQKVNHNCECSPGWMAFTWLAVELQARRWNTCNGFKMFGIGSSV